MFGLRLNFVIIPTVLAFFCVLSIFRYTMNKEDHARIRELLAERHERGHVEVTEEEKKRMEKICGQKWEDMWIGRTDPAVSTVSE